MFRLERVPENIRDILLSMLEAKQARMWTALPCIIESVNFAKKTCVAQPAVQLYTDNADGTRTWINLPPLLDVPLVFPSGGGFLLSFPVQKGDEALVVFSSRCIDQWWQSGAYTSSNGTITPQKQAILRMHDLSDGFAIVGISSVPNVPANISQNSTQLRSAAGDVYVEVKNDKSINIVNPYAYLTMLADGSINPSTWAGMIAGFATLTAPPGWLACPTAPANISRTTYANLFARIGTTFGAGDGSTTFGMPWFPTGYAPIAGTPGTTSVGQVINHVHPSLVFGGIAFNSGSAGLYISSGNTGNPTTGGTANLAAGTNLLMCVKY